MKQARKILAVAFLCIGMAAFAQDEADTESQTEEEAPPSDVREEDEEFIPSREVPAAEEVVFPVDI